MLLSPIVFQKGEHVVSPLVAHVTLAYSFSKRRPYLSIGSWKLVAHRTVRDRAGVTPDIQQGFESSASILREMNEKCVPGIEERWRGILKEGCTKKTPIN